MKQHRILSTLLFFASVILITSCATTHPNARLIVGTWKPEKIEKYIDPNLPAPELASDMAGAKPTTATKARTADTTGKGGAQAGASAASMAQRKAEALDRLIRAEERSTMTIAADGNAAKNYPGTTIKVKWKMKSKGTHVVGKELGGSRRFDIEIVEISESRCTIIQRTEAGDLKITYVKQ